MGQFSGCEVLEFGVCLQLDVLKSFAAPSLMNDPSLLASTVRTGSIAFSVEVQLFPLRPKP